MKHHEDAQDVVQNAFEKLWLNREKVIFSKARSYLFTVAYRNMIDIIRKVKRIDWVESVPEQVQHSTTKNFELRDSLNLGLNQLNDIQKSVILLRDYEGYAYKEIAEITGLTVAQVKVYIYRARKKLQQVLVSVEKAI
jgi:RNA polymerase sigma-70 factor (ECF subfamily)